MVLLEVQNDSIIKSNDLILIDDSPLIVFAHFVWDNGHPDKYLLATLSNTGSNRWCDERISLPGGQCTGKELREFFNGDYYYKLKHVPNGAKLLFNALYDHFR